jgi:hypothetical protein
MKSLVRLALVGLALALGTVSARADIIFSFSGGGANSQQQFTYGFHFTPVVDVVVDSLGFYDFGLDGLAAGHRVGIWTSGGSLLASTTVTTANSTLLGPVVNNGQFRFTQIAGLHLDAGTDYVFGAAIEGASDVWYAGGTNISFSPSLVTVSSTGVFTPGNFVFPNQTIGNRYAAGSFTASAVPAPSGVILACLGVAGTFGLRRRFRKVATA